MNIVCGTSFKVQIVRHEVLLKKKVITVPKLLIFASYIVTDILNT